MSEEELRRALGGWVEKSGRALELRTARMFRQIPEVRLTQQSVPYDDVETQKQREGDVVAVYHWLTDGISVSLEVAIECKSAKSEPWVAFYDEHVYVPEKGTSWWGASGVWPGEYDSGLVADWLSVGGLMTDRVATHAVSALGDDRKNHAQDATQQALSLARARHKGGPLRFTGDEVTTALGMVIPVVLTQAPLYKCELTPDGGVSLEPVEGFDVWLHLSRSDRRRVYVRTEAGLANMAQGLARLTRLRAEG